MAAARVIAQRVLHSISARYLMDSPLLHAMPTLLLQISILSKNITRHNIEQCKLERCSSAGPAGGEVPGGEGHGDLKLFEPKASGWFEELPL